MRRSTYLLLFAMVLATPLVIARLDTGPFDTGLIRPPSDHAPRMLPTVAHGGGETAGLRVSSSLDALDANRGDFQLFEIDLSWTADNQLICLHDWDKAFAERFGFTPKSPITLAEFEALLNDGKPRNCTLMTLLDWLDRNPGTRVITDLKERNLQGLEMIARLRPDLRDRFIPQAYQPQEIAPIRAMGFPDVIWTLYRFDGTPDAIIEELETHRIFALTMPKSRAFAGLAWKVSDATGVQSYVHTINDATEAGCFAELGITGIYTDVLRGPFPPDRPGKACVEVFR